MNSLEFHYEAAFSSAANGNIYQELAPLDRLAHNRRVELLAALPLQDLSNATVVDYGVGAWGVGAVFSKLKTARRAIGIDISSAAIAMSRKLSTNDPAIQGCAVEYHAANGYALPIETESVDLFFSGECIEHIEDTDLHLAEVNRVLKPGGMAVFTTPNAEPWIYRQFALKWCVGFEHVALMSTRQLVDYLERYFVVERLLGFNQSMHPSVDKLLEEDAAQRWVRSCEHDAFNATSVIAMVRKEARIAADASRLVVVDFDASRPTGSKSQDLDLSSGFQGRMIDSGGTLSIDVPRGAIRCNLILWSHSWSGRARIRAGGSEMQTVDLYSHVGGCHRIVLPDVRQSDAITIESLEENDPRSQSRQVIFFRAVFACREI